MSQCTVARGSFIKTSLGLILVRITCDRSLFITWRKVKVVCIGFSFSIFYMSDSMHMCHLYEAQLTFSSWPKMKVAFIHMLVMVHLELFPCQVFTIIVYSTACIRMNLIMNITTQLLPDFWISGSLWFSRLYSFLFCIFNSSLSPSVTIA